ncbi:hypothetical protein HY68_12020 [Streptomyces sp. AcH 505]|uniref:hypothetical protein n=1 Tax=Streptomyces sp. AcH 505 TaxID=352211 RepID=UPI000591FAE6|nr:hypothetical protein HY68_12020 [Streptomyces sp. AcH 505]
MAGSEHSDDSGNSNDSVQSVMSVHIDARSGNIRTSSRPVPNDAPQLPAGTTPGTAVYDQTSRTYFAGVGGKLKTFAANTKAWVSKHDKRIKKAVIDVAPQLATSIGEAVPGKAGVAFKVVGVAGQAYMGATELNTERKRVQGGGMRDTAQEALSAGRIVSAVGNAWGAAGSGEAAKWAGQAGTWIGGGSTVGEATHHFHKAEREREASDPAYELPVYEGRAHNNTNIGYEPGEMVPGSFPSSHDSTSNVGSHEDWQEQPLYAEHTPAHDPRFTQQPTYGGGFNAQQSPYGGGFDAQQSPYGGGYGSQQGSNPSVSSYGPVNYSPAGGNSAASYLPQGDYAQSQHSNSSVPAETSGQGAQREKGKKVVRR